MAKVCKDCEYEAPTPEDAQEPPEAAEDCPKCGGIGTVVDEAELLEEGAENEAE